MLRRVNFHYLLAITLCVLFALLNFVDGRGGASELQPLVLRFIDSHYLENDFFVNSSEIYNVRHYIVRYLSLFVNFFGIERGMHIAGLLSFISTLF